MPRGPGDPHRDRPRRVDRARGGRLLADGGAPEDDEPDDDRADEEPSAEGRDDHVEVMEAGEAEPAEPKWKPPNMDDIPDFEVRADEPLAADPQQPADPGQAAESPGTPPGGSGGDSRGFDGAGSAERSEAAASDPTAGRPHDAQAPGATAVSSQETETYIAALEICTRLPDEVRLPDEAADLVPAAVEAELEQDIQQFAAAEFDNDRPHVDVLAFDEVDEDIWLRIRIGIPAEGFSDLDPEVLRSYALQRLEGVF